MTPRLLQGCCLEVLPTLDAGSVDLILSDLPYAQTRNSWDSAIDLDRLWPELWRVLKPRGAVVMTSAGLFTARLMMSQPKHYAYKWVWRKSKATNFLNVSHQPLRAHEDVPVFYRAPPTFNPQRTPGAPYNRGHYTAQTGSYGHMSGADVKSDGGRHPVDVLYLKTAENEGYDVPKSMNGTQKPIDLGRYFVRTYSNPGETVIDVACGSGAFVAAALLEGRRGIGIELRADQIAEARENIRIATAQRSLF